MTRELPMFNSEPTDSVASDTDPEDNYCRRVGCGALCCRAGVEMPLTEAEVSFMNAGGTELEQISEATRLSRLRAKLHLGVASTSWYRLQNDCGYLKQNTETQQLDCTVHEDPSRPRVCQDFKGGSYSCHMIRLQGGLESPEEFEAYDRQTRN